MRPLHLLPLLLLCACGERLPHAVQDALVAGNAQYHAQAFSAADSVYAAAPSDAWLAFNRAHALYRLGNWSASIEQAGLAQEQLDTLPWKAYAWHDRGTGYLRNALMADSLSKQLKETVSGIDLNVPDINDRLRLYLLRDSLQRSVRTTEQLIDSSLTQARQAYEQALRLEPALEDSRHNLMVTLRRIAARPKPTPPERNDRSKEQRELSEKARLIMARADELVDAYRFDEALKVLQQGLQHEPSLAKEQEYMKKLELVTSIRKGS